MDWLEKWMEWWSRGALFVMSGLSMVMAVMVFFVLITLTITGCKSEPTSRPHTRLDQFENSGRFNVESHGSFYAGHSDNRREIVIITDSKTKKSYIGVTGVGVTELYEVSDGETSEWVEE